MIKQLDDIMYEAQRQVRHRLPVYVWLTFFPHFFQGRISFYMTCTGEEAIHIGTSAALTLDDIIFAQYREVGAALLPGRLADGL